MLDALHPLLAALARLLVAKGVPFPELAERLKAHYVAAALTSGEGKATDSRLSVQTGLQRRDVARLRAEDLKAPRPGHLARLITRWQTEPVYRTPAGAPRVLNRTGSAPSFDALARSVRKDIHPRTLLDALTAAGTARHDTLADTVALTATAYLPAPGTEDQLAYLAANTGAHLAAATANVLTTSTPPFFERALHYGDLSQEEVAAMEAAYKARMMEMLEALRDQAAQMKRSAPRPAPGQAHRFRAGGYVYTEQEPAE